MAAGARVLLRAIHEWSCLAEIMREVFATAPLRFRSLFAYLHSRRDDRRTFQFTYLCWGRRLSRSASCECGSAGSRFRAGPGQRHVSFQEDLFGGELASESALTSY